MRTQEKRSKKERKQKSRNRKAIKRPHVGICRVSGKLKFPSKAKARKDLRHYSGAETNVRNIYRCHYCGMWHLTKQKRQPK